MKKYLIISDAGSMHVYNFIKHVLLGRNIDIYILSHSTTPIPERNRKLYADNNIKLITTDNLDYRLKRDRVSQFRKLCHKIAAIKKIGEIDVCHIHYLHIQSCLLYLICRKQVKHLILSYWGSDIILKDRKTEYFQKKCFKHANLITLTVSKTLRIFHEKFGDKYDNKVKIVRFGSGALQEIRATKAVLSKTDCKQKLGIPPDKISIVLGYNALPAQHHLDCIKAIKGLQPFVKSKIHIVVPLQYGRVDEDYIIRVKQQLQFSGCDYITLDQYMSYDEIAVLSCATDIYVNARETDAFSNTMKEMLYAGAFIIHGKWLVYEELDDIRHDREQISTYEGLGTAITKTVNRIIAGEHAQCCQLMWTLMSPEGIRRQWDCEYSKIL